MEIKLVDIEAAAKHYSEVIKQVEGMDSLQKIQDLVERNGMIWGLCRYFRGELGYSANVREIGLSEGFFMADTPTVAIWYDTNKKKNVLRALTVRRDWLQNKAKEMKSNH